MHFRIIIYLWRESIVCVDNYPIWYWWIEIYLFKFGRLVLNKIIVYFKILSSFGSIGEIHNSFKKKVIYGVVLILESINANLRGLFLIVINELIIKIVMIWSLKIFNSKLLDPINIIRGYKLQCWHFFNPSK